MGWDYVYEEEHFDFNGYCSAGVISNGSEYLFFAVCCDIPGGPEICRIYDSITFSDESKLCQYEWTAENDSLLFDYLNSVDNKKISEAKTMLRSIPFIYKER